jgi:hypothetical protein
VPKINLDYGSFEANQNLMNSNFELFTDETGGFNTNSQGNSFTG